MSSKDQSVTPGPDPLFPRLTDEDLHEISLRRNVDVALWRKGEPYPPALAKKFQLTGRNRKIADNQPTKRIVTGKAKLRKKIAGSPGLVEDFEFFLDTMDWHPEMMLQHLYWDSNMMHADPQTIIGTEKKKTWPIDRETLREIRENIRVLSEQIERLNKTDFSPARTAILRDEKGNRLHRADERHLLEVFRDLPGILSFYGGELSRKLSLADVYWPLRVKDWIALAVEVRRTSLYERIRGKSGQYHAVRLHRLVNAARQEKGLPLIKQRAFIVWLNKLKKRCQSPPNFVPSSHPQKGSPPSPGSQSVVNIH